jgi:Spy/CpxP family protein refolding chaperone
MHPRTIGWTVSRGDCCSSSACEGSRREPHHHYAPGEEGPGLGGAFGVRRPLRFLAWKLQLDERQVSEMARILDELKTERAQGAVDERRTLTALADAVAGDAFDEAGAGAAARLRVESAERLQKAVVAAVGRIHALLDSEQRARLAYMIRTGTLVL